MPDNNEREIIQQLLGTYDSNKINSLDDNVISDDYSDELTQDDIERLERIKAESLIKDVVVKEETVENEDDKDDKDKQSNNAEEIIKDDTIKKQSKKKNIFFNKIKNIFFEEDESYNEEDEASDELDINSKVEDNNEAVNETGIFSKLRHKIKKRKEKNAYEDKLEDEAEALENERIKKEKEEKKKSKLEKKKSKAGKEKKSKDPKVKKEKIKKETKPEDILKINIKSIIMFVLFILGVVILITVLNMGINKNSKIKDAKKNYELGNYQKTYESLSELSLTKSEKNLYDKACVIMYVQRQYDSYLNYSKMNLNVEALDSLIKGLDRYEQNLDKAIELEIDDKISIIKQNILNELQNKFKISESDAFKLLEQMKDDFYKYNIAIKAYEGVIK